MQTSGQNGKQHEISVITEIQARGTIKWASDSILVNIQANSGETIAFVRNLADH